MISICYRRSFASIIKYHEAPRTRIVKAPTNWILLLGALLVVAALYNHYLGHSVYLVEIILIAVGTVLAITSILVERKKKPTEGEEGILVGLLSRFLTKEQCALVLPVAGFAIIVSWSAWKVFVVGSTDLRLEDFIVTLFGLSLVLYYAGPSKYAKEKDFVVLYLMFMTIVFAVIWKAYVLLSGDSFRELTGYSEFYFITLPTVYMLQAFGLDVRAELDLQGMGLSNTIEFDYHGNTVPLGIGSGCSGLYSVGLFFSAFMAFVIVRYRKVDRYVVLALAIGFLLTWLSNIIRMALTIWVGSVWGAPALAVFHSYIGIVVFVIVITIFWILLVRWLDKVEPGTLETHAQNEGPKSQV